MAIQLSIQTHLTLKVLENNKPTQALLIRKRVVIYAFVTEFAFRIFEVRQKHSIRVEPNRIPFFFSRKSRAQHSRTGLEETELATFADNREQ